MKQNNSLEPSPSTTPVAKRYLELGVSANKEEVHQAVASLKPAPRPTAFCRVSEAEFPSAARLAESYYSLLHADGAGTKPVLAYLYWKETGEVSVFRSLMQDAYVMNLDDALTVGAVDEFAVSSTILRNKARIPAVVLRELIEGGEAFLAGLATQGITVSNQGGETADMGDVVKTLSVEATVQAFIPKEQFLDAGNIAPGQVIVGFASSGESSYEKQFPPSAKGYNSGIGANGLTLARHALLSKAYSSSAETFAAETAASQVYSGSYSLLARPFAPLLVSNEEAEFHRGAQELTLGKALLAPTRTYLPLVKHFLPLVKAKKIQALIHLTGGGQTKPLRFGGFHLKHRHFALSKNHKTPSVFIEYVKDNLFPLPPLFALLAGAIPLKELFAVFNAGHRLEAYTDEATAKELIAIAAHCDIPAKVIGYTQAHPNKNATSHSLRLSYAGQTFSYSNG